MYIWQHDPASVFKLQCFRQDLHQKHAKSRMTYDTTMNISRLIRELSRLRVQTKLSQQKHDTHTQVQPDYISSNRFYPFSSACHLQRCSHEGFWLGED